MTVYRNSDFDHTPADVLRWLLIQVGVATDPHLNPLQAWPCWHGKQPDSLDNSLPDNVVTTLDTEGHDDGRLMTGEICMHYGFQLVLRAADEPTGKAQMRLIRKTLAEGTSPSSPLWNIIVTVPVTPENIGGTYLVPAIAHIGPTLGPFWEQPSSKRNLFTVNATLTLAQIVG